MQGRCSASADTSSFPGVFLHYGERYITQAPRVGLYKTIIIPTVPYGAESWTLTIKWKES
jgi:hypothetical protein